MPSLVYSLTEFHGLHGESITDPENQCVIFADGAAVVKGMQIPPPTDPTSVLRARRHYVSLKLAQEENSFDTFKNDCSTQLDFRRRYGNNSAPGPPPDYLQQLERGKERIKKLRDELAAFDREIEMFPEEVGRRAHLEQRRQQISDAAAALNELRALKID